MLGPQNVGMITGDATVNHDAPVTARDLLSPNFCTKEEKQAIARAIDSSKKSASTLEQLC